MVRMDKDKKDHFNKYQVPMKGVLSFDGIWYISKSFCRSYAILPTDVLRRHRDQKVFNHTRYQQSRLFGRVGASS